MTDDDLSAIERSVAEPAAFAAVYQRHVSVILRYMRRRLGDEAGEDMTHEVFLRAFRQREGYRPQFETAAPWLFGIAANVVADHHRIENRRQRAMEALAREPQHAANPQTTHGLTPAVLGALRRLPLADRETLLLLVWGELSYAETAAALDLPVGTVRSRVARARSVLQDELSPSGDPARPSQKKGTVRAPR